MPLVDLNPLFLTSNVSVSIYVSVSINMYVPAAPEITAETKAFTSVLS